MCSIYTLRCLVWTYLSERCQAVRSPSLKFPTFRLRGSMPTTRPIDGSSWRSGGTRSHSLPSSHQVWPLTSNSASMIRRQRWAIQCKNAVSKHFFCFHPCMGTFSNDCVNGHTVVSKAHHLDDAPTCVKFFSEILRDGGKLVALVPFQSSQANTFARLVM